MVLTGCSREDEYYRSIIEGTKETLLGEEESLRGDFKQLTQKLRGWRKKETWLKDHTRVAINVATVLGGLLGFVAICASHMWDGIDFPTIPELQFICGMVIALTFIVIIVLYGGALRFLTGLLLRKAVKHCGGCISEIEGLTVVNSDDSVAVRAWYETLCDCDVHYEDKYRDAEPEPEPVLVAHPELLEGTVSPVRHRTHLEVSQEKPDHKPPRHLIATTSHHGRP